MLTVDSVGPDRSDRSGLEVSTPRQLVELPPSPSALYSVMANDELLLLDNQAVGGGTRELHVALNFVTELKSNAPASAH